MKFLLDTNVISEPRRRAPDPRVLARLAATPSKDKFVSVISVGELFYGIAQLNPGKRRRELETWLEQAEQHFADQLLPVNRDIARLWGNLTTRTAKVGRPLNVADGLIAATAIHHGLHVMTRNVSDFEATGVLIVNPWDDP